MPHFFLKLIPPRASFSQDMSAEERAVMNEHIAYFNALFEEGKAVLFGPVLDPKGAWGMGVLEIDTEEEAKRIIQNDPSVKSGINTFEILPVYLGKVRAR